MNQRTHTFLRYIFVVALGVFLHFAYKLSGNNPVVGLFALTTESIWEHLKLIFYPMLLLTLWDLYIRQKNNLNFLPPRSIGILAGMIFTIVVFYTVTGVIGDIIAWVNILIYFLSVIFAFWIEKRTYAKSRNLSVFWSVFILLFLLALFIIFTLSPPDIGLFRPMAE